jgi:hypothetical protein
MRSLIGVLKQNLQLTYQPTIANPLKSQTLVYQPTWSTGQTLSADAGGGKVMEYQPSVVSSQSKSRMEVYQSSLGQGKSSFRAKRSPIKIYGRDRSELDSTSVSQPQWRSSLYGK